MRFMMIMLLNPETAYEPSVPTAEQVAPMAAFNNEMLAAGVMLSGEGLQRPALGARISFASGKPVVTDGPFAETKEVIGGFWLIQVASKEEAVAWATRCPGSPNETIELRQVFEMSDFPEDVQRAAGF